MKTSGFTLIEVLVALAIVATALLAAMRAVGELAVSSRELELRFLANMSAQNRVATVRAAKQFLPVGTRDFSCPQGNFAFTCREEIKTTPNTLFRRVEVRVYLDGDESHYFSEVIGILGNEGGP